jgi:hypothetical protein
MSFEHESTEEHTMYSVLYKSCLTKESQELDMVRFRNLFKKSNLPKEDLKMLYVESIKFNSDSQMDRLVFGIFCKFLTLKVNNLPISRNHLQTQIKIPGFLQEEYQELTQCTEDIPSHPENPVWDPKYQISEQDAREYVEFICTKLHISMIDSLDTVVLLGKNAKEFFQDFNVDNGMKRDLWIYLDRENEQKLKFFFIIMALHFFKLKIKYNVWVLGLFKRRDFDDRYKVYFNDYMTRSHTCKDINEFFMVNFNCPFQETEKKQLQPSSEDNEDDDPFAMKENVKKTAVLRKDSEIDEPRCIPKKEITCQNYNELYNEDDPSVENDFNLLEKLNDPDRDKMFQNILGYFGNNISIHQNRQREFKEELVELEREKVGLLKKLEQEQEELKKKIQKQNNNVSEVRHLTKMLTEVLETPTSNEEDLEFDSKIDKFLSSNFGNTQVEKIEKSVEFNYNEMRELIEKLGTTGFPEIMEHVQKKLKKYNINILQKLGQPAYKLDEIAQDIPQQKESQVNEQNAYQKFEENEEEDEDFFKEMDEAYRKDSDQEALNFSERDQFKQKADNLFGDSDDEED